MIQIKKYKLTALFILLSFIMVTFLAGCDLAALSGVIMDEEEVEISEEREDLVELGVIELVEKHYEFLEEMEISSFKHTLNPREFEAPPRIIPENNGEFKGETMPKAREKYAEEYEEKMQEGYSFKEIEIAEVNVVEQTELKAIFEAEVIMEVETPGEGEGEENPLEFEYDLYMELHSPMEGWHITVIEKNSQ